MVFCFQTRMFNFQSLEIENKDLIYSGIKRRIAIYNPV